METQTLQAEARQERGKGPARQLRMSGKIPGVLYGAKKETVALSVDPKELMGALSTEYGKNAVITVELNGQKETTMVKELQVHPVTREFKHVDFWRVSPEQEVSVKVPLKTTGRAVGVQKGGKLTVVFRELPVRCAPELIPAHITVDVTDLDMGAVFKVEDLALADGVTVEFAPDRRIILITEDRRKVASSDDDSAEGASEENK